MSSLQFLERLIGRRLLWKVGRRLYLHARREGSLDMEHNGEVALQRAIASAAAAEQRSLTVFDVGANYGQWSTNLLRALSGNKAPRANLTLFEPVSSIRNRLETTMKDWAKAAEITVEAVALSDQRGTAEMVVADKRAGTHHLHSSVHNVDGDLVRVDVTTLDDYLIDHPQEHIDLIKIDAEGTDAKIIAGMARLLERGGVDLVQFEYSVHFIRTRSFLSDIFQIADRFGYRVALLTAQAVEFQECWHPDLERFYASPMLLVREGSRTYLPSLVSCYRADNTRATRTPEFDCKGPNAGPGEKRILSGHAAQ